CRRRDGTTVDVFKKCAVIQYGGKLAFLSIVRDITEQKLSQLASEAARAELERLVVERTAELTLANVSLTHEVRERARIEDKLREMNERLEDLAAHVPGMLFQTRGNMDGTTFHVPYISPGVFVYTGWTAEEILDRP